MARVFGASNVITFLTGANIHQKLLLSIIHLSTDEAYRSFKKCIVCYGCKVVIYFMATTISTNFPLFPSALAPFSQIKCVVSLCILNICDIYCVFGIIGVDQ